MHRRHSFFRAQAIILSEIRYYAPTSQDLVYPDKPWWSVFTFSISLLSFFEVEDRCGRPRSSRTRSNNSPNPSLEPRRPLRVICDRASWSDADSESTVSSALSHPTRFVSPTPPHWPFHHKQCGRAFHPSIYVYHIMGPYPHTATSLLKISETIVTHNAPNKIGLPKVARKRYRLWECQGPTGQGVA
jgi:hypothetical protein